MAGEPTLGKTSDGRIELFCRFTDGSVRRSQQSGLIVGTSWTGWTLMGAATGHSPASGRTPGFIQDVYCRDSIGLIRRSYQTSVDGGWSAWESLGGSATGAPIVGHNEDGRIQVLCLQSDGRMWSKWQLVAGMVELDGDGSGPLS